MVDYQIVELSPPKNVRDANIKQAVESAWTIEILRGTLNGQNQFVISIKSHLEDFPSYYKYADFMHPVASRKHNIEIDLMNRGALGRSDFLKIQLYIEGLIKDRVFSDIGIISPTLFSTQARAVDNKFNLEEQAEVYFDELIKHVQENPKLFPVYRFESGSSPNEGYMEGISHGVYIDDPVRFGSESLAILPKFLRKVLNISDRNKLGSILNIWKAKGYLYVATDSENKRKDRLFQLHRGMPAKRVYIILLKNTSYKVVE